MNLLFQSKVPLAAGAQLATPAPQPQTSLGWFSIGAATINSPAGAASGVSVRVSVYSDQPGLLVLQQTDDPGLQGMIYECARRTISGGNAAVLEYGVTAQYWRFVYTNGPNAQTVMSLNAFSGVDLNPSLVRELQRLNLQILAMRGKQDNSDDDLSQL